MKEALNDGIFDCTTCKLLIQGKSTEIGGRTIWVSLHGCRTTWTFYAFDGGPCFFSFSRADSFICRNSTTTCLFSFFFTITGSSVSKFRRSSRILVL